jgi:hypothetical protein
MMSESHVYGSGAGRAGHGVTQKPFTNACTVWQCDLCGQEGERPGRRNADHRWNGERGEERTRTAMSQEWRASTSCAAERKIHPTETSLAASATKVSAATCMLPKRGRGPWFHHDGAVADNQLHEHAKSTGGARYTSVREQQAERNSHSSQWPHTRALRPGCAPQKALQTVNDPFVSRSAWRAPPSRA